VLVAVGRSASALWVVMMWQALGLALRPNHSYIQIGPSAYQYNVKLMFC